MKRGKGFPTKSKQTGGTPLIELLIDGYNLMFESVGHPDPRDGVQGLRRAREYMLRYLAERLTRDQRARTWIVFDSATDLHLAAESSYREIRITFARVHNSADELLIQIIQSHSSPKQLTVVSSDHQIQRRAKARGARALDSEDWMTLQLPSDPLVSDPAKRGLEAELQTETTFDATNPEVVDAPSHLESTTEKRDRPISPEEKEHWLDEFGF